MIYVLQPHELFDIERELPLNPALPLFLTCGQIRSDKEIKYTIGYNCNISLHLIDWFQISDLTGWRILRVFDNVMRSVYDAARNVACRDRFIILHTDEDRADALKLLLHCFIFAIQQYCFKPTVFCKTALIFRGLFPSEYRTSTRKRKNRWIFRLYLYNQ